MTQEQKVYLIGILVDTMNSAGQDNWSSYDMHDMCCWADRNGDWLKAKTRQEEEALALECARSLGVKLYPRKA